VTDPRRYWSNADLVDDDVAAAADSIADDAVAEACRRGVEIAADSPSPLEPNDIQFWILRQVSQRLSDKRTKLIDNLRINGATAEGSTSGLGYPTGDEE